MNRLWNQLSVIAPVRCISVPCISAACISVACVVWTVAGCDKPAVGPRGVQPGASSQHEAATDQAVGHVSSAERPRDMSLFLYEEDRIFPEVGTVVRLEAPSFNKHADTRDKVDVHVSTDGKAVIGQRKIALIETGSDTGVFEGHTGVIKDAVYGERITVSLPDTDFADSFVCYKPYRDEFTRLKARIKETPSNRIGALGLINRERKFLYQSYDEPKLRVLREKYKLDEVMADAKDELGRQVALLRWLRNQL